VSASLDSQEFYLTTFLDANFTTITSYYSPKGVHDSVWFNSKWTNPFIYHYYNLRNSIDWRSGVKVDFTDGNSTLYPRANYSIINYPDSSYLLID
jgi:hypothetical protein